VAEKKGAQHLDEWTIDDASMKIWFCVL